MVRRVGRAAAITQDQTLETTIIGLAHGRADANVRRDAGQDEIAYLPHTQGEFQIRGVERPLSGFVDDDFARDGRKFVDDVPAGLPAHQDAAALPGISYSRADPA